MSIVDAVVFVSEVTYAHNILSSTRCRHKLPSLANHSPYSNASFFSLYFGKRAQGRSLVDELV